MPPLPRELIKYTISLLDPDDTPTLLAAPETSSACYRAATPLLYQHLKVTNTGPGPFPASAKLRQLCHLVATKHHLAQYPLTLSLTLDSRPRWTEEMTMSDDGLEGLDDSVREERPSTTPSGLGDLRTGTENTLREIFGLRGGAEEGRLPDLAALLPASLKELTIVCEGNAVRRKQAILEQPFVAQLEECVVLNSQKTKWYKKTGGTGRVDPVGGKK